MATKRKSKSTKRAPERSTARISEEDHDAAMRVLRAEYYQSTRSYAEEIEAAIRDGEISTRDAFEERLHAEIDGSQWIIYTHLNFQVLLCSSHYDAYMEEYGQVPADGDDLKWSALAFAAFEQDVREFIDDSLVNGLE